MKRVLIFFLALMLLGVVAFADNTDTSDHTHSPRPVPMVQMVE